MINIDRSLGNSGLTLIELMVVLALIAILASLGVPSFQSAVDKYRLKGVAENIYADMQYARLEALKNNQAVFLNFTTGTSWCYGFNGSSACDCATAGSCTLREVSATQRPGAVLQGATFASSPSFEPIRGLASQAGDLTLVSPLGRQIRISMNLLGRIDVCTPSGSSLPTGYPAC